MLENVTTQLVLAKNVRVTVTQMTSVRPAFHAFRELKTKRYQDVPEVPNLQLLVRSCNLFRTFCIEYM